MEDDVRMFRARVSRTLLEHLRRLPKAKVRRMQESMRKRGLRIERQDIHPGRLFVPRPPDGPVRTSTGYYFPRPA